MCDWKREERRYCNLSAMRKKAARLTLLQHIGHHGYVDSAPEHHSFLKRLCIPMKGIQTSYSSASKENTYVPMHTTLQRTVSLSSIKCNKITEILPLNPLAHAHVMLYYIAGSHSLRKSAKYLQKVLSTFLKYMIDRED